MIKPGRLLSMWTETSLVSRIVVGLVIGAILGITVPQFTSIGILGQVFVNALKALAPILVALLVASSITNAGGGLGRRFRVVIFLYLLSTVMASLCAVTGSTLFPQTLSLTDVAEGAAPGNLNEIFGKLLTNMVANPLQSVTSANYIGILFWAVVAGLALKKTGGQTTINVLHDFAVVVTLLVKWVIQFAPFGILGLVFTSVSQSGLDIFTTYGRLLLLLVGCMLFNTLVLNPFVAYLLLRRNPYPLLFKCLRESGLNAFFTRSSAANIPINLNLCKSLGISEDFYSVSIPLGATINMNGAAVTITVMTLAVAHTVGVNVSFGSAMLLSIVATLGACGASGVAGGSLLLIPMACSFFGISSDIAMQAVGVGFIIGVVQDSVETALNSSADVFFTAIAEFYNRKKSNVKGTSA